MEWGGGGEGNVKDLIMRYLHTYPAVNASHLLPTFPKLTFPFALAF